MLHIANRIATIKSLVEQNTSQSLTYAALECRLTIEAACYERLMVSHSYLPVADLKKWQPKDVVRQVVEDANPHADQSVVVSVGRNSQDAKPTSRAEFEALEFVELGRQAAIDLTAIGKLWNSLSNVALHVHLPGAGDRTVNIYGENEAIKSKVEAALREFEKLALGNMLVSDFGVTVTLQCDGCGGDIKRKEKLLREGQIISCSSSGCEETYQVTREGPEALFARQVIKVPCPNCSSILTLPKKSIMKMKPDEIGNITCGDCGLASHLQWQLMHAVPAITPVSTEQT